jgi:hypothetical protein
MAALSWVKPREYRRSKAGARALHNSAVGGQRRCLRDNDRECRATLGNSERNLKGISALKMH